MGVAIGGEIDSWSEGIGGDGSGGAGVAEERKSAGSPGADGEIGFAVAVQIANGNGFAATDEVDFWREGGWREGADAAGVSENRGGVVIVVGSDEVRLAVAIEIGDFDGVNAWGNRKIDFGAKANVARCAEVLQKGNCSAGVICHGEVRLAVAIEIANGDMLGSDADRIINFGGKGTGGEAAGCADVAENRDGIGSAG